MRRFLTPVLVAALCLTASAAFADLMFSEYVEGTSNNKAVEIYNPGAVAVSLSGYEIRQYNNGVPTPTYVIALSPVSIAAGDVYVVAYNLANATVLAAADQQSTVLNFNGDDALVLTRSSGSVIVDSFGQVGFDPGSAWGIAPNTTVDHTLRRRFGPDTITNDAFDPAVEWSFYSVDTFNGLGYADLNVVPADAQTWGGIKALYR